MQPIPTIRESRRRRNRKSIPTAAKRRQTTMSDEPLIGADDPDLQQKLSNSQEEPNDPPTIYKCPFCPCIFLTPEDIKTHLHTLGNCQHQKRYQALHKQIEHEETEIIWYPSKYTTDEWLTLQTNDPELTSRLQQLRTVTIGNYSYRLNGKWIVKKQIGA
jgi:hypothetical protein